MLICFPLEATALVSSGLVMLNYLHWVGCVPSGEIVVTIVSSFFVVCLIFNNLQ